MKTIIEELEIKTRRLINCACIIDVLYSDNSRVYDDMPPHIDTQPLPRKLRQLMESGGEGKRSRDEQGHSNKDIKTTQHVSTNRRRCCVACWAYSITLYK